MQRILPLVSLSFMLSLPSALLAQVAQPQQTGQSSPYTLNHAEVGVYADYMNFRPGNYSANYVGVGGRFGLNVHPNLALEAEMNYDFARNFTTTYTTGSGAGASTTFVTTSVRPLTGLFGPKVQFGTSGPFRAFVTGKLGFINFDTNTSGVVSGSTFTGAVDGVGGGGTHLAFYPGGGIEMFGGPIGFRAEAGDEIYLNNGVYNNLRVTAGPTLRF